MPLYLHLLIHLSLAILTGYVAGRFFKNVYLGLIAGLAAGFFIDLDHVLEYFLVFGPSFNLQYFLESRQFLLSDKIRLYFHAWEYVPLFLAVAWLFRKRQKVKIIFITLAIAGTVHLISDVFINNYNFKYYSLVYRYQQDFASEKLLSPAAYQFNQEYKQKLGI